MVNWTLEVVVVPVSDVDRAKAFYADQLGFNVDHDTKISEGNRIVQLTPQGSGCSIVVGEGLVPDMAPGSLKGCSSSCPTSRSRRGQLLERGVEVSEIQVLGESPTLSPTRSTTSASSSSAIPTATGGACSRSPRGARARRPRGPPRLSRKRGAGRSCRPGA